MGGLETGCGVEERGTDHGKDQQGDEGGAGGATEQASVRAFGCMASR